MVFDSLQSQFGKLLGKGVDDAGSPITAEQLRVVLQSIESKYNNVKTENTQYKSTIDEQRQVIAELEQSLTVARTTAERQEGVALIPQLQADLDEARRYFDEQQAKMSALESDRLQLQSKLTVQDTLIGTLRQEVAELRERQAGGAALDELARVNAELSIVRQALQASELRCLGFSERAAEADLLNERAERLEAQLQTVQAELLELGGRLESAEQACLAAEAERDGLRVRVVPLMEELDVLKGDRQCLLDDRESLSEQLDAVRAEADAQRTELTALRDELSTLAMDREELLHQVGRQASEIERLQLQQTDAGPQVLVIAELESRLLASREDCERLESDNQALRARLEALAQEPATLSARERTEWEFKLKKLTLECQAAHATIAELRVHRATIEQQQTDSTMAVSVLRQQVEDVRRDRNILRERLAQTRQEQVVQEQVKTERRAALKGLARLREVGGIPKKVNAEKLAAEAQRRETLGQLIGRGGNPGEKG